MERSTVLYVCSVVLAIFLVVLGVILVNFQYQVRTESFVQTHATIIDLAVQTEVDNNNSTSYTAVITYSYLVNGKSYQNDEYGVKDNKFNTNLEAKQLIDQFTIGQEITVYYNQNNPQESVITRGIQPNTLKNVRIFSIIAIVLIGIGILIALPFITDQITRWKVVTALNDTGLAKLPASLLSINHQEVDPRKLKYHRHAGDISGLSHENSHLKFQKIAQLLLDPAVITILILNQVAYFLLTFLSATTIELGFAWLVFFMLVIVLTGLGMYIYFVNTLTKLSSKYILTMFYPLLYGLIALVTFFAIPVEITALGLFVILTAICSLIPYGIAFLIPNIHPSIPLLFIISIPVGLLIMGIAIYLNYRINDINVKYAALVAGKNQFERNYIADHELFCIALSPQLLIGNSRGQIIELGLEGINTPQIYQIHHGAVLDLKIVDDLLFTISNDKLLKVSSLKGATAETIQVYPFESIPKTVEIFDNNVYVGTESGDVFLFSLYENNEVSLNLMEKSRVFNRGITTISCDEELVYVGSKDKYVKLLELKTLQEVNSVKIHTDTISDLTITKDKIMVASLDGKISVTQKEELKNTKLFEVTLDPIDPLNCIVARDNVILAGSQNGNLYKIDLNQYKIEKDEYDDIVIQGVEKFKLHNYWIEDMVIDSTCLYSISSDKSVKAVNLQQNLKIGTLPNIIREETHNDVKIKDTSALGDNVCVICGKEAIKELHCSLCNLAYHRTHFNNDLPELVCPNCYEPLSEGG